MLGTNEEGLISIEGLRYGFAAFTDHTASGALGLRQTGILAYGDLRQM